MRVDLKCGEYLNFNKIRRVEILDHDIIRIKGNVEKGRKSVIHETHVEAIKNIKEFNRFLRKEMKEYHADGVCEYCDSLDVMVIGTVDYTKKLNEPKVKKDYKQHLVATYRCNKCNRLFSELKPVDMVIYYK